MTPGYQLSNQSSATSSASVGSSGSVYNFGKKQTMDDYIPLIVGGVILVLVVVVIAGRK